MGRRGREGEASKPSLNMPPSHRTHFPPLHPNWAGAALLKHGRLQRRATIIPLDKISGAGVTREQAEAAHRASHGRAREALTLVGYDDEVRQAPWREVFFIIRANNTQAERGVCVCGTSWLAACGGV